MRNPPLPCREPVAFGTVPGIEQNMRHGSRNRLKGADKRLHQLDHASEGPSFRFADRLLAIHLRSQRTVPPQQHLQTLKHAVTGHALVPGGRMMQPQSFHLLPLGPVHRRVIPDQIPYHDGWLGTPSALQLPLALSLQFCRNLRLHHFPKVLQPAFCHRSRFPPSFRQKPLNRWAKWCNASSRHRKGTGMGHRRGLKS